MKNPAGFKRTLAWPFFLLLVVSTAAVLYAATENVRNAEKLAERALHATALAISTTVAAELNSSTTDLGKTLSDRVIAYAYIADTGGRLLYHSNKSLAGNVLDEEDARALLATDRPSGRNVELGTGLPAYEFVYPLSYGSERSGTLVLVLNAVQMEEIVDQANHLWWIVGSVLAALWVSGALLLLLYARQRKFLEEMEKREKLAIIGRMTATLAHEIRNAIGSVKGFAQWLEEKLPPDDPMKTGTGAILQGTGRVEELVRGLLDFSREETFTIVDVPIRSAVEEALLALPAPAGDSVEILIERNLSAMADRERLVRVLVNCIKNAGEASGPGGAVRISAGRSGTRVTLAIEDDGPGIAPENKEKLFTPFFTTKATGTGLGLAYSRKVIEGMKGSIELESLPVKGARLKITLPAGGF